MLIVGGTEPLLYVPQRQAAKKAAEHIKSDLKFSAVSTVDLNTNNNTNLVTNNTTVNHSQRNSNKSTETKKSSIAQKDPFDLLKEDTKVYNKTTVTPTVSIFVNDTFKFKDLTQTTWFAIFDGLLIKKQITDYNPNYTNPTEER